MLSHQFRDPRRVSLSAWSRESMWETSEESDRGGLGGFDGGRLGDQGTGHRGSKSRSTFRPNVRHKAAHRITLLKTDACSKRFSGPVNGANHQNSLCYSIKIS